MRRPLPLALAVGLALALGVTPNAVAHEGSEVAEILVEPASLTAGDTVVLAGSGLEPDDERVIVLAGGGLVVEYGTVTTDAEGAFSKVLTIPAHLPPGEYELRAIGDEILTTALAVTGAASGAQPSPTDAAGGAQPSPTAIDSEPVVMARERSAVELGVIVVLAIVAAIVGILLVLGAERFQGHPTPPSS